MLLPGQPRRPALLALALLMGVNFLNYIDRYIIAAVAPLIQADFRLTDNQLGVAMSMFMVAYVVVSPFSGVLGDAWPRRYLVGVGVVLWSLATAASGMATGYASLLVARSFIGVGEAGFGVVAPTYISDLFTRATRGRMLAFFYVAIPVGSALGYLLGGTLGTHFGWRSAFLFAGAPGLLLGLLAFWMYEPPRGAGDGVSHAVRGFDARTALGLARNRTFLFTCLGFTAMTFGLGALASWMPTLFYRLRGVPLARATFLFGAITAAAGLIGTFLGGFLGDALAKRTDKAYLLVSGVGMIAAAPFAWLGLTQHDVSTALACTFVAEVLVFLNTGPANAVLVNVALPEVRATAIAASIFVYHVLGDVPSPILVGRLSDASGNLEKALLITVAAMVVSGILYLIGSLTLGADTRRVIATVAAREGAFQGDGGALAPR
jgi:MFS transporter, Spinster family, sphingosine-1-phosphate transporter